MIDAAFTQANKDYINSIFEKQAYRVNDFDGIVFEDFYQISLEICVSKLVI